jgi:hypothetical protein
MDFESLPMFGAPFEHVETYVYYDGPKTFAMRSPRWDIYYFVNAVDEDESDYSTTFLAVGVNRHRFEAIRSGLVKFRDAYVQASRGALYSIVWRYDAEDQEYVDVKWVNPSALTDSSWLPAEGVGLDLHTPTAPEFDRNEVAQIASAQGRTAFAVKLDTGHARITQFPQKQQGQVEIAISGVFDALVREITPPGASARDMYTVSLGTRASSFVILLGVESPNALVEPVEVSAAVFEQLENLLRLAGEDDKSGLIEALGEHKHKARNRFKDILEPLAETRSGIALTTSVAYSEELRTINLAPTAVRTTLNAIKNVARESESISVHRGVLIGKNVRLERFEIFDASSRRSYYGYMTDAARDQAAEIPVNENSLVRAEIRREWAFAGRDEPTGARFTLTWVESLGEVARDADLPTLDEASDIARE